MYKINIAIVEKSLSELSPEEKAAIDRLYDGIAKLRDTGMLIELQETPEVKALDYPDCTACQELKDSGLFTDDLIVRYHNGDTTDDDFSKMQTEFIVQHIENNP